MVGDWSATQTTTESFSSVSGDLRNLRTPSSLEVDGIIYGYTDIRTPILYDYNNTGYYLNPAGDGTRAGVFNGNLEILPKSQSWAEGIAFTMPTQAVWGGLRWVRSYSSPTGNWALGYLGTESTNDMAWWSGDSSLKWRLDHSGNETASGSSRAPIFYDSNDTNYYVDANSNSRLVNLGLGGVTPDVRLSVSGDIHVSNHIYQGGSAGSAGSWGSRTLVSNGNYTSNARSFRFDNVGYGSTWGFDIDSSGNAISNVSMRAPIFYDSNNTGYYLDPNADLSLYVFGEICNSNYAQGNLQPGALNICRTDRDYLS